MYPTILQGFSLVCLLSCAGMAGAQEQAQFDLSVGGVRAGAIAFEGDEANGTYNVRGSARTAGMIKLFAEGAVDVAVRGTVESNHYRPQGYEEAVTEKDGTVRRSFRYRGGVPEITRTPPRDKPQKNSVAPEGQAGTVDPLTAIFAILRDRPEDLACDIDLVLYDGARRSGIRLNKATPSNGGLVCEGSFTRIAGYSEKEMAEQQVWPLRLTYERLGDGTMRVTELAFDTRFGHGRARRR
jgi:hypothetical protein